MSHSTTPAPSFDLSVFISADQIRTRIAEMGREIDAGYGNEPIYLISVLKGSFMFLADLSRAIKHPVRIEFMGISSYGRGEDNFGPGESDSRSGCQHRRTHVLIVEDIIDSGVTLNYLLRLLEQRKPSSIRIATLLDKPDRGYPTGRSELRGFRIPDEFVVGYGLDYAEDYRNLPDIRVLKNTA